MQIQINQNNALQPNFCAQLKILNVPLRDDVVKQLKLKANLVGTEEDVIELKYSNYKCHTHYNSLTKTACTKISEYFTGKYIPGGEGEEIERLCRPLYAIRRTDLWKLQENVAIEYLDKLVQKFKVKI